MNAISKNNQDKLIEETINLSLITKLLNLDLITQKQFYILKEKIKMI